MSSAATLHERAKADLNRGAFGRASVLLDEAHRATADGDLRARIELTRAYLDAETGDADAARNRCTEVLSRGGLGDETTGMAWSQLGLLWMRAGDDGRATAAFERAVATLPPQGEHMARVLLNRGNVHLQRGDARAAAADFAGAEEQFDLVDDVVERSKARHNLGYARLLSGDLVGALQMIDSAAEVLSTKSAVYRATIEQDRAEVLTAAGRSHEAVLALEAAAAAYGARRLRTYQAECELTLAWTLLRQDPGRARVVARRAARRFRGQASPARALHADAAALSAEVARGDSTTSIGFRAEQLANSLRKHGKSTDATLLDLQASRVALRRGDLDHAAEKLRHVRVTTTSPMPTRLLSREVRAELAAARGDSRRARRHVRAGLADLHDWQASFGSLDLQSTLVGHGRDLATMGLELALGTGDPATVYEWSERARALAGRVVPVRPPVDEQLADDLTELRLLKGQADQARARELRRRVRQREWYAAGPGAVVEPAALEELHAALKEDVAVLVAHLVLGERVVALVIGPDGATLADLGGLQPLRDRLDALTSDLTMAAAHRDDALAAPLRAGLRRQLTAVADQLVTPLADVLGHDRVVLTPSGALAGAPWGLLPGLLGRPLTIPPSATRWLGLRQAAAPHAVGLVAGPGVARGEEEVARAAAAWWDADLLCGPDATSERVAAMASRVDVLHLAGHGRHTRENPLFSAVELYDGAWFGYDIDQLPSVPSTVVLSACELGRVSVRSGEEAIGMSAAWLHAGARTVLSSPVLLADDVACDAMARWHNLVARGAAPADALAEATASADDVVAMLSFGGGW